MQVVVDSLLTHYEVQGKGRLVLLLHGWGDSAAGLSALQRDLAKKYQVMTFDLPGFGNTESPPSVWGLNDYVEFTAHFLRKINAARVAVLVGHSNGGAIAVRGLATGVLQADKLVLLASAGIRGTYKGRVKLLRYITKAGKALVTPLPKVLKDKIRRKVYHTVGSDMLVAEHLQETFKKIVTDDIRADAARLTLPTLLIYGKQDDATPVAYGQALHKLIRSSKFEVVPGAGHFVHLDRAPEVAAAITEFIA